MSSLFVLAMLSLMTTVVLGGFREDEPNLVMSPKHLRGSNSGSSRLLDVTQDDGEYFLFLCFSTLF